MSDSPPKKILVEFSLLPEGKQRLQRFFDGNFERLRLGNEKAQAELQNLLREVLPEESQESLRTMFSGKSEYALLMHNFPEREGLEKLETYSRPQDTYGHFTCKALFRLHGSEPDPACSEPFSRKKGYRHFTGDFMHRDYPGKQRIGTFFAPYNGEHAAIQIIDVQGALEAIPQDERRRAKERRYGTLDNLLAELRNEGPAFVHAALPVSAEFQSHIKQHSEYVDLQHGDMLIVDEAYKFHCAQKGNPTLVSPDAHFTRILMRGAGTPALER